MLSEDRTVIVEYSHLWTALNDADAFCLLSDPAFCTPYVSTPQAAAAPRSTMGGRGSILDGFTGDVTRAVQRCYRAYK